MFSKILIYRWMDQSRRRRSYRTSSNLRKQNDASVVLLQVLEPNASIMTPYDMVPYIDADAIEQRRARGDDRPGGPLRRDAGGRDSVQKFVEQGPIVR